ncbi:hypothetical protein SteCoe_17744 [Stentor coeruleus]|uniref:Uncharacterized protein n=1 Tax=Stentor coeruleus TaxID=5963 RepID=A0A1R2BY90_9CILI|nr:hypothetical protein SteCoe_17744 [Stentor coeruleus]
MSNSIIDALNESIQNFKITRARNRSGKPSPSHTQKDFSAKKINSSSSETENFASRPANTSAYKHRSREQIDSSHSSKLGNSDSFARMFAGDTYLEGTGGLINEGISRNIERLDPEDAERTASFVLDNIDSGTHSQELQELFAEISELKKTQKSLENQVTDLEDQISKSLKTTSEPLKQSDMSSIMSRIGGLQEKFSNRNKSAYSTEKLSDLFEKISKLEMEAERIKRENNEVESLYHQSLNEIYQKIEKLKAENKSLTDIILSSSVSSSPKHIDNKSFQSKIKEKPERQIEQTPYHEEISLKKVIEEDIEGLEELYKEREALEIERENIEKELQEIPVNSKSMANKKKKQALEGDLAINQSKIAELDEKINLMV